MSSVFADTSYWIGVAFPKDTWHAAAKAARGKIGARKLVTTDEVLTECLCLMGRQGATIRTTAVRMVRAIMADPNVRVIPQTRSTFLHGMDLYERRSDKSYSLVDCSSMAVMRSESLSEVLSTDEHFKQDGFINLLQ